MEALIAYLRARWAEERAEAMGAIMFNHDTHSLHMESGYWAVGPATGVIQMGGVDGLEGLICVDNGQVVGHMVTQSPAAVIADLDAKEQVAELWDYLGGLDAWKLGDAGCRLQAQQDTLLLVLRCLARKYQHRPDFPAEAHLGAAA